MSFDDLFEEGDALWRSFLHTQDERHLFGRLSTGLGEQLDITSRTAITLEFSAVILLAPLHNQYFASFFALFQLADHQQWVIRFKQC